MLRSVLYALASASEVLRFFILGSLSEGSAGLSASVDIFRYAASPHLLLAAGFFFLWLDAARYAAFRPLLILGTVLNLASYIPLGVSVYEGLAASPPIERIAVLQAFGLVVLDLFALLALLLGRPVPANGSMAGFGLKAASEAVTGTGDLPARGPRGPEDIEGVEV